LAVHLFIFFFLKQITLGCYRVIDISIASQHYQAIKAAKVLMQHVTDGPQHYILLTGFHQAQLLPALEALGVAVDHVIKVEREHAPEDRDPSGQGGGEEGENT
jgi:hypothetical protein